MDGSTAGRNPRKGIFDALAEDWDAGFGMTEEKAEAIQEFVDALRLGPSDRVLDVGCGTGVLVPFIRERLGEGGAYLGLDVSDGMVAVARRKGFDARFRFLAADLYGFDTVPASFDAIIVFQAFPHLHAKPETLSIFEGLLKPGGRLCIAHVASSCEINSFHKERTTNPTLRADMLPSIEELSALLHAGSWRMEKAVDRPGRYQAVAVKTGRKTYS